MCPSDGLSCFEALVGDDYQSLTASMLLNIGSYSPWAVSIVLGDERQNITARDKLFNKAVSSPPFSYWVPASLFLPADFRTWILIEKMSRF